MGLEAPTLFDAAAAALPAHLDKISTDVAAASQLYQVFLFMQIECPHPRLLPVVAKGRAVMLDAFCNDFIHPSQSQAHVSEALTALGWSHDQEFRTEDGLSLDMAQPATKTAVEFDGPTHYLKGPNGPSLDGRTAFKRRLLAKMGWRLATVPYFEWDPLVNQPDRRNAYLKDVLAKLR